MRLRMRVGGKIAAAAAVLSAIAALGVASSASASGSPVIFSWWTSSDNPAEIDSIDLAFDKAYPGYQANGVYIAQSDNYLPKVISAIKTGTQPTVLFDQSPSDLPELAESGKLITLNGKLTAETNELYPGIKNSTFYRGKQLGIALGGVGDIALFYNKKDFAAAGIKKPPATWTQLQADAAKLTVPAKKQYGFYVPTGDAEWISYDWEPVLYGDGGALVNKDQTKATFNSAAGVNALNTWVNLVKDGYAPKASYAAGGNYDGPTAFSSGAVAMITDGQWLEGELPKGFDYGVAPYPAGSKGQSTSIGIGVVALLKTTTAADKGGLDLIKFLASPKEGAYLTKESGGLPSAPAQLSQPILKHTAKPPFYNVFAADEKYGQVRPITPAYNALSEDLWTAINAAIAGKESASSALNSAASQADKALASQG